jgi:predicted GNAT family acetyltransferase
VPEQAKEQAVDGYTWTYRVEDVDLDELSHLYRVAPMGDKPPEELAIVFGNSMFACFVYFEGALVGAGRALADGADCAYIGHVAVHPEHQGKGLGSAVVRRLVELSRGHKKIILYANPGTEAFYHRLGFLRMSTAMGIWDDPDRALEAGLLAEHV